ncbi:hypothetical protein QYE76_013542 [Lolium multiflorum]|uniref:Calmodulin-binding domain-containing protein n=1 Tax=Lolium multiflorum TaxID=4521 RepID=A0AAD8X602_LOLMU|nr:hypothetical protein QYE76_013542 [Lolium multiflorum]
MVRSKEVPKKPKDPLLTPPSKPRGFSTFRDAAGGGGGGGGGGSLPRNRGGAAMTSPAPASVPNYMRGTSSSGAKAGQRASASASTPTRQRYRPLRVTPRGKVLFPAPAAAASPGMVRPTCSSTLKDAKFPRALDLAPGATDAEGPAAMRVCPYTYCSLNGHAHAPAVPLRSFLASRRRLIKTQQSMKHKGVSAFRKGSTAHQRPEGKNSVCAGAVAKVAPPVVDQDALGDFFVEVYTGPRVSSGTSCSDMSLDEMDATVRRMEFVVFDRCGAEDDVHKSNDLAVHGDGEARPGVCSDSSSECSDPGISGNLVEELPWMRYQGYECDSLDDDVSEEQIGEAEALAQQQEGEDEEGKSCGSGDEHEEDAVEEQEPEDEEIVSDLPSETGIVAEEEGVDCRLDTGYQHEASTGEETQDPGDDEECVSDGGHEMEIAAERTCAVSTVEVCREQEEDEDIILGKVCQADTSDGHGTSEETLSESEIPQAEVMENVLEDRCKEENSADQAAEDDETNQDSALRFEIAEKQKDGESEMEISETVPDVACEEDFCQQESTSGAVAEVCQGDTSDGQGTSQEKLWESEIPKAEVTERVENVLEDGCKEENSADQEGKDDETNIDSALRFEIAKKQKDDESEMEISETVPDVVREEDFCEQEATSRAVAEGEISDSCAVGSPDVEIWNQPTDGGFEQDGNTAEDAFEQLDTTADNTVSVTEDAFEQLDTTAENTVSDTEDAQRGLEMTTCKSEDSSEESGINQESSLDVNSVCVDAMQPEITEHGPEDSSEESSVPLESSQSNMSAHVDNGAQIEVSADATAQMEPEITECKLEESSEEPGIPQESSQSSKSALVNNDAETEPEFTTCKSEDACEESGIAHEVVHDGNSAYLGEGAQMQLGNVTSEFEATSEECGIAQEIGEDQNSAHLSDDAQNGSELTMCELDDASESVAVQETDQDHNCEDVVSAALNEYELITPSELANVESGVTQEAVPDDNNAGVNDGPERERETMACEPEHAHEELDIIQEGDKDGCAAGVCAGALKETQTSNIKDACEEVCVTEEANLSHAEHNYDLSTADSNVEPQSLPAEDDNAKEFSVDDMCNVFSGMNLKGDVYVDPTESEISPRKRLIIAGRRRTPEEEEHLRGFNPRGPNFLPLELDPDSEKVDLKHQTAEDRKNAEEWMIDYALRRAVNNLGARKKKVELLVQAFETVLPHDEDEKKSTPTRAVQACN